MNKEKNSRTTQNRKLKENIFLKVEFTSHLQSKDLAPSSIEHYIRELSLFLAWI
jgi:hypothetical protein